MTRQTRREDRRSRSKAIAIAVRKTLQQSQAPGIIASTASLLLATPAIQAQQAPSENVGLEEVTVTAQRRAQSVQDIPYNISAVDGNAISQSGATTIDDLTRVVTGLTSVDAGPSARAQTNNLTLRGLRTDSPGGGKAEPSIPGQTVNSVSTYFGETPVFFPMALQDVERVEVLRGPQGTLYGSGAEAGTIRFIPRRPQLDAFGADLDVTGSWTEHSSSPNNSVHAVLNLPISDHLAARLVAGEDHLAGFINAVNLWVLQPNGTPAPSIPGDVTSGPKIGAERKGVNSSTQSYARAAVRWKATDGIDVELGYLHQHTKQDASQASSPTWSGGCFDMTVYYAGPTIQCPGGTLPKTTLQTNAGGKYTTAAFALEPYTDTIDLGSLVASIDLGLATLTSATSYYEDRNFTSGDETGVFADIGGGFNFNNYAPYNNYPRLMAPTDVPATDKSFVQELRLVSSGTHFLDYVVGAYYQHDKGSVNSLQTLPGEQEYLAATAQPNPSALGDVAWHYLRNTSYDEKAIFGELTGHITRLWQVTVGGRFFWEAFGNDFVSQLPLCGPACAGDGLDLTGQSTGSVSRSLHDHIKKFNTSYDLSPNTKIYATYSEGFRHGGTNPLPIAGSFASLPQFQVFAPDLAKNYELGIKGSLLDRRVRYSAAAYLINLSSFQFNSRSLSGYPATYNGDTARSSGFELEGEIALTHELSVTAGYTYTKAKTTAGISKCDYAPYASPGFGGDGTCSPLFNISNGAKLPGVPVNTANFGADYRVPGAMFGHDTWKMVLHVDGVYRSSANGDIDVNSVYFWQIPSSFIANARGTLNVGDHASAEVFVNNVTSDTAYSGASNAQTIPNPYSLRNVSRPRTIGVTLRYTY